MTQSLSLHAPTGAEHPGLVETHCGKVWWRCLPEYRALVESGQIDWTDLRERSGLKIVKHNGHRTVWHVQLGGADLFLKTYRPDGLAARIKQQFRGPTAKLEWDVGHYAAEYDVSAVRPVACGWLADQRRSGPSWLMTAAVPRALALSDYWLSIQRKGGAIRRLIDVVARLIARAHQCGFHHRDMHAANILVRVVDGNPEALFVDLHNVQIGRSVPTNAVLANLAQLNQWFRWHASRPERLRFLQRYMIYRDQFATASRFARNLRIEPRVFLAELNQRAMRHAERLWAKRDRRASRDGRYFCRISPGRRWSGMAMLQCKHVRPGSKLDRVRFDRVFWQEALANPRSWLGGDGVTVLKDSHTAMVTRREVEREGVSLAVIAKRPIPRSVFKRLAQRLGRSRNLRTWRMANKLVHRDLPTAHPLAVLERRAGGLFCTDSLLLMEAVEHLGDLEAYVSLRIAEMPARAQRGAKDELISSISRLLRSFTERGFVHRDFKASNVLVSSANDGGSPERSQVRLVLIDLDGVSHRPGKDRTSAMWRAAMRLAASLQHVSTVTRTDQLRCLLTLLRAPGMGVRDWKSKWREMAGLTDQKLAAKARRKRWKLEHYGRE